MCEHDTIMMPAAMPASGWHACTMAWLPPTRCRLGRQGLQTCWLAAGCLRLHLVLMQHSSPALKDGARSHVQGQSLSESLTLGDH